MDSRGKAHPYQVIVQPFGGFGLSGTDSKAGGPDYLPLHMLPRTVVERF